MMLQECVKLREDLQSVEKALMVKGGLLEQNIPSVKPIVHAAHEHAVKLIQEADRLDE